MKNGMIMFIGRHRIEKYCINMLLKNIERKNFDSIDRLEPLKGDMSEF